MRMILVLLALILDSVSAAADCGYILWTENSTMLSDRGLTVTCVVNREAKRGNQRKSIRIRIYGY